MKFSIIVPAYNAEKYIAETLDCLLAQSEGDLEIIVVNDGSTDSTQQIVERYSEKNSSVVLINQKNAGVSAARNKGIESARGEYIIFIDSDDLISSDALEHLYDALKSKDADLAIYRVQSFGVGGEQYNPIVDELVKENIIDCYDKRLVRNFIVSNKAYKTELLKKSGILFPSMKYTEDGAFFMDFIHTMKPKIVGVSDALFMYRKHSESVTHRVNSELVSEFSKSMDYIYNIVGNSFEDAPEKKEDYIQELLCKDYLALMNEFYRALWKAEDDETLPLIGNRCEMLLARMNEKTKARCVLETKDLGTPIFSKKGIEENPFISVKVSNPTTNFIQKLYNQSMPLFEIVEKSEKPKGKVVLKFKGNEKPDPRLFKGVALLKRSPIGFLPGFALKFAAKIVLKIK